MTSYDDNFTLRSFRIFARMNFVIGRLSKIPFDSWWRILSPYERRRTARLLFIAYVRAKLRAHDTQKFLDWVKETKHKPTRSARRRIVKSRHVWPRYKARVKQQLCESWERPYDLYLQVLRAGIDYPTFANWWEQICPQAQTKICALWRMAAQSGQAPSLAILPDDISKCKVIAQNTEHGEIALVVPL